MTTQERSVVGGVALSLLSGRPAAIVLSPDHLTVYLTPRQAAWKTERHDVHFAPE